MTVDDEMFHHDLKPNKGSRRARDSVARLELIEDDANSGCHIDNYVDDDGNQSYLLVSCLRK